MSGLKPEKWTQKQRNMTEPEPNCVQGTVAYRQRSALPPRAIVEVNLQDVSRQDRAAEIVSTQTIHLKGQQVPISFELSYDSTQIVSNHSYAVQVRILVDGQLRFISTSAYRVITQGHPTQVAIVVQPVNQSSN